MQPNPMFPAAGLAGGNEYTTNKTITAGEDGILTSYEIGNKWI